MVRHQADGRWKVWIHVIKFTAACFISCHLALGVLVHLCGLSSQLAGHWQWRDFNAPVRRAPIAKLSRRGCLSTQNHLLAGTAFGVYLVSAGGEKVAVAKLQVALLGSARSLQRQLDRLADRADTTTPEGLHYVLQGARLALFGWWLVHGVHHPARPVRCTRHAIFFEERQLFIVLGSCYASMCCVL